MFNQLTFRILIAVLFLSVVNIPVSTKAQEKVDSDSFFGLSQNDLATQEQKDETTSKEDAKESKKKASKIDKKKLQKQILDGTPTGVNKVAMRVNSYIITDRQISVFFALRQLSSFLAPLTSMEEVKTALSQLLGLEDYSRSNNLLNIIPTRSDVDRKVDYLNTNLGTKSLQASIDKIDPSGSLTPEDLRSFFYYQALEEKGFVYLLQQDFIKKIFTPREDEIQFAYKKIMKMSPVAFSSPTKIYIVSMVFVGSTLPLVQKGFTDKLNTYRDAILKETDLKKRQKLFISYINKYSDPKLRNPKIVGPIDEELANSDFPEYKDLFKLNEGDISKVIDKDNLLRIVYIVKKDVGETRSITDPNIRGRIMNIIYQQKAQLLFQSFLKDHLKKCDVEYY